MPRRAIAKPTRHNIPSDESVFRGFQKLPKVLINRPNLSHLLKNIRVKYDKNGSLIPYSADAGQERILRKIIVNCTVNLVKIDSKNVKSVSKKGEPQNNANELLVVDNDKKKRGKSSQNKKPENPSTPKQTSNTRRYTKKLKKCEKCNKTFKNLNNHYRLSHTITTYECVHCSKKYKREPYYKKHIELHCKICYVLHQNEKQLMEHTLICRNIEQVENQTVIDKKYICNICTDQFDSNCAIAYHKAAVHSDNPPSINELYYLRNLGSINIYVCYFCKESSVDKEYLESHVSVLQNMSKKIIKHPCDQCRESFDSEDNLLQHIMTHATPDTNLEVVQNEIDASTTDCNTQVNNITDNENPNNETNEVINIENSNTTNLISNDTINNVDTDNIETATDVDPVINDVPSQVVPDLLENLKREVQIPTVQTKNRNECSNTGHLNGLIHTSPKKRNIYTNTKNMRYHCKMCEKYFTTNCALEKHHCPEIERVRTKLEKECSSENWNQNVECMDIDYPMSKPLTVHRSPVTRNVKSLQEDLVFNIVVREVPIEFYST
ncbi:PREDICTED: zinc finger protein 808-like [Papilio xuthus]|uniref:Zinc finger protein 808-like n=1 Tax=Papilio xuthus TaxID=66420 RepID=A0AAJ6ZTM2_PAPXU|nr:PREDICTED: zinc finger protein 808-like [Papilio xuthus]